MRISDWSSDVCSSDLARGQVYPWRHQRRRLTDAWRAVLALHATAPSRASMKNVITSAATYWCKVGVTFIFLDLSRDRYFMLERSAATRFSQIVGGAQEEGDKDWLAARGLNHLAPPIDQSGAVGVAPTSCVDRKSVG